MSIKKEQFVDICLRNKYNASDIIVEIRSMDPNYSVYRSQIEERITRYIKNGDLPLSNSNNSVSKGEVLKGTTTTYDKNGNIKTQVVRADVPKTDMLNGIRQSILEMTENIIKPLPRIKKPKKQKGENLASVYISNDLHFGALMWDKESGEDYNVDIATSRLKASYDYLIANSPDSKVGIVCDLGDLTESDNQSNMTPKSGHTLSVDSRFQKMFRLAYEGLIYGIQRALEKHEIVYFYNIAGNHDLNLGIAVREIIRMTFMNNKRVIVDDSPQNIKYHQHGTTLLQFVHGDDMRMNRAGDAMAIDCKNIFSSTEHRFSHFGHMAV